MDFLYEANYFAYNNKSNCIKETPEYIKERFIILADKLLDLGFCRPYEF